MIKRILFLFTLVLISNYSFSQVNFGIRTGFVDAIQEDYFYNSDTQNTNLTQVIQIEIAYNLNLN